MRRHSMVRTHMFSMRRPSFSTSPNGCTIGSSEEWTRYFNQLDVFVNELALHIDFHQPAWMVMAMLTDLPAEYWTIIEHIELGRITKQLNILSSWYKLRGGDCCDQALTTTSNL
jgi:hypothetical protein